MCCLQSMTGMSASGGEEGGMKGVACQWHTLHRHASTCLQVCVQLCTQAASLHSVTWQQKPYCNFAIKSLTQCALSQTVDANCGFCIQHINATPSSWMVLVAPLLVIQGCLLPQLDSWVNVHRLAQLPLTTEPPSLLQLHADVAYMEAAWQVRASRSLYRGSTAICSGAATCCLTS
jgi:hypothetical protein